jgi:hypothetical protein
MFLAGSLGVVVEVVYHKRCPVSGQVDVEFEKERDDAIWCRVVGGQTKKDVALSIDEVKEDVRCQRGPVGFRFGGKEKDMVVCAFAELEEGERFGFG